MSAMKYSLFSIIALVVTSLAVAPALADMATDPMDLGTFGGASSFAYGVSDDGSVVVGDAYNSSGQDRPFRWTQATGMTDLGTFGGTEGNARNVSTDGNVVVGWAKNSTGTWRAFRWTQQTGMVDLGTLGGTANTWATSVSADGTTVVGRSPTSSNSAYHAFRWTQQTGMVDLGALGGIFRDAEAQDVSDDGSVVVGWSYDVPRSVFHAFRWTQATGMTDLGTLGGTSSGARGISDDNNVLVGWSQITGDTALHAFRWTQETGLKDLNALLTDAGVNMSGITLTAAYSISANGQYIVGQGDFPGATQRAFLVCYDPDNGCVGLTTGELQTDSARRLSDNRRSMMIESRATANELLGMTQPMDKGNLVRAGAMFGSAMGYVAGQASLGGLTALGGLGYGQQDYAHVEQSNALTAAAALRYTFLEKARLHPYVELGGWATPEETMTFKRSYLNGSGSNSGSGSADASAFAGYGRGGLIWDATPSNRLVGYGEYGRQYLSVSSYVEASGAGYNNPFPAEVNGGLLWMNVARAGFSWTHDLGAMFNANGQTVPLSFTLAGAAAHSFDPRTGLRATLTGAGTVTTPSHEDTWGEFGARIAAQFTKNVSFGLDFSGSAGADPGGASFHGGAALAYAF